MVMVGLGRYVLYIDSSVLWRAVMAECEGKAGSARGLATRYMSTLHRVPKGVGVGVHVC
jgi:hypothetical protein